MKTKKFPLDWKQSEDQVYIFFSDSTLIVDLPSYKKNYVLSLNNEVLKSSKCMAKKSRVIKGGSRSL